MRAEETRGGDEASVASRCGGAVGDGGTIGSGRAVGGEGAVCGGGSWAAVGEAARGEEDIILLGEEGRRCSYSRSTH
jgi:hypothetical protein